MRKYKCLGRAPEVTEEGEGFQVACPYEGGDAARQDEEDGEAEAVLKEDT